MREKLAGKRISDGFTIVELVVVIAVVAVLAAVLIPTFAGIIEKAKASKETQESRNERLMERIGEIESGLAGESGQSGGTGSENDHALLLEDLVMVVGDFVRYDDGGFSEISSSDESVVAVSGSEISAVGIGEAEVTLRRSLASSLSSLRFTVKVVESVVLQPGNNFQHSIDNLPVTDVVFGYTWEHTDVAVPENRQDLDVRASAFFLCILSFYFMIVRVNWVKRIHTVIVPVTVIYGLTTLGLRCLRVRVRARRCGDRTDDTERGTC